MGLPGRLGGLWPGHAFLGPGLRPGGPDGPPAAARPGHHGRRRAPGSGPHGIPAHRGAHPLPPARRARCRHRGGRRGRRAGAGHLLLRDQRRVGPRAPRRLPRGVPRPARGAGRGVLPPPRGGGRDPVRGQRPVLERGRHGDLGPGPEQLRGRASRRTPRHHPAVGGQWVRVVPQHPARRRHPRHAARQACRGRRGWSRLHRAPPAWRWSAVAAPTAAGSSSSTTPASSSASTWPATTS